MEDIRKQVGPKWLGLPFPSGWIEVEFERRLKDDDLYEIVEQMEAMGRGWA